MDREVSMFMNFSSCGWMDRVIGVYRLSWVYSEYSYIDYSIWSLDYPEILLLGEVHLPETLLAWLISTLNVFLLNTGEEGCDEFWRAPTFGQLFGDFAESSQRFVNMFEICFLKTPNFKKIVLYLPKKCKLK